jgi:hypothetical protein
MLFNPSRGDASLSLKFGDGAAAAVAGHSGGSGGLVAKRGGALVVAAAAAAGGGGLVLVDWWSWRWLLQLWRQQTAGHQRWGSQARNGRLELPLAVH